MMTAQPYYGQEFDPFVRANQNHRIPSTSAYYERPVPYSYYEQPRQDLRTEYGVRTGGHVRAIHEAGPDHGAGNQARRRIQVACSRCRRRKIKCSGDPGDGSGCTACRMAQQDTAACNFIRVGTLEMPSAGNGGQAASSSQAAYHLETASSTTYDATAGVIAYHQPQHRPSLPMLQTRTAYPSNYEAYDTSPVMDGYTYASSTIPRPESYTGSYGPETGFRPWTSGSVSSSSLSTSIYYEPGTPFPSSFGNLQVPPLYGSQSMGRLPSVTGESFSPLNMSSLHTSLPAQTVQERRLPAPYSQQGYQQPAFAPSEIPQIRPLAPFADPQPRVHISGIHSLNGMPWSTGPNVDTSSDANARAEDASAISRSGSMNNLAVAQSGQPLSTQSSRSNMVSEFGYTFTTAAPNSPEISPTAGPTLSDSFQSASGSSSASSSMLPASHMRYSSGGMYPNLPAPNHAEDQPRPASSRDTAASLYSFSGEAPASSQLAVNPQQHQHQRQRSSPEHAHAHAHGGSQTYQLPRHAPPQQQPHASFDGQQQQRRRASNEQQRRSSAAHRISVPNLNARY